MKQNMKCLHDVCCDIIPRAGLAFYWTNKAQCWITLDEQYGGI